MYRSLGNPKGLWQFISGNQADSSLITSKCALQNKLLILNVGNFVCILLVNLPPILLQAHLYNMCNQQINIVSRLTKPLVHFQKYKIQNRFYLKSCVFILIYVLFTLSTLLLFCFSSIEKLLCHNNN